MFSSSSTTLLCFNCSIFSLLNTLDTPLAQKLLVEFPPNRLKEILREDIAFFRQSNHAHAVGGVYGSHTDHQYVMPYTHEGNWPAKVNGQEPDMWLRHVLKRLPHAQGFKRCYPGKADRGRSYGIC